MRRLIFKPAGFEQYQLVESPNHRIGKSAHWLIIQIPVLHRIAGERGRIPAFCLVPDVCAVRINGAPGDEQLCGYLPAAVSRSDEA